MVDMCLHVKNIFAGSADPEVKNPDAMLASLFEIAPVTTIR